MLLKFSGSDFSGDAPNTGGMQANPSSSSGTDEGEEFDDLPW